MKTDIPVRFGIVGLSMGGAHARHILSVGEGVCIGALCDLDANRRQTLARELGLSVPSLANYDDLLALENLDAVIVAVPNDLHHPFTLKALAAGKHVLCEKPPALSATQTREMFAAAKNAGKVLMISLNQRFDANNAWLRRLVEQGELGEPYYAKAGWLRRRHTQPGWFTTKARSGGGPLIDLGVHLLDLCLWLMGYPKPKAVTAHVVNRLTPQVDVEDLASAFIQLENGAAMTLEASLNLNIERETVFCEVCGTRGGLRTYPPAFFAERHGADVNWTPVQAGYVAAEPAGPRVIRHFAECVRTGKPPLTTPEQMDTLMRILDAIYASGKSGKTVELT